MRTIISSLTLIWAALAFAGEGYDLRANLPLGHTWEAGVIADAAEVGFVKYTRDKQDKWRYQAKAEGRVAALPPGIQANLWLPVGPELSGKALAFEAVIHPFGKDQRLDVFADGKKIGSPKLSGGWQTIRVALPGEAKEGIIKLRMHFRHSSDQGGYKTAAALRAARLGEASAEALPHEEAALAQRLKRADGGALTLPAGGGLDWYIVPPKASTLKLTADGELSVYTQVDGQKPKPLASGKRVSAGLSKLNGQATRLMIRASAAVKLSEAIIESGEVGAAPKIEKPKYVIFWLIDTLRADKVSFCDIPNTNKRKVKTPHLDALVKESTNFDPFYIQGNESKSSHASLFTGTYPVVHKVYTEKANLSDKHTTIAEAFKKAGYKTQGFCSNGYISEKWNYTQGFDGFENFIRDGKAHNAKAIIKSALPWIDKNIGKSFYLYLGTTDPHVTYRKHKKYIGDYHKADYNGPYNKYISGTELGRLKGLKSPPPKAHQDRIEALYENEIAFNDEYFGQLVAHLKEKGIYDDTMILITGDHGDEFWEHGSCGHGHSVHQELVRVPMIVKYPKVFPAKRVSHGTEAVDLLPTLMELLGQKIPADVQGASWLSRLNAKDLYPEAIIASQGVGAYGLEVGPAKVIMRSEASIEIYDVKADPGELKDLMDKKQVLTFAAMDPMSLFLAHAAQWDKAKWGAPNNLKPAFNNKK